MFIVKRNQVIITALVVMIAAAGYLNYIDTKPAKPSEVVMTDADGDASALVPNTGLTEVNAVMNEVDGTVGVVPENDTSAENPQIDVATNDTAKVADGTTATDAKVATDANAATDEKVAADDKNATDDASAATNTKEDLGAAVFVNSSTDSPYFIQAKLDREQAMAKQKEILVGMINNPNLEQASKAQCADEMLKIQDRIEKESASEALIKSKGISEAYVRIDGSTVDVVVSKEVLSDAEVAQIEDIIKRKTGLSADSIRINTLKK